jgi:anti-sigma factor (TIGR02949 family)
VSAALPGDMSCKELVDVITDYLEGAMPASDRARFEAHLDACPWCWTYLEQMRETIDVLGQLSEESLSEEARDQLLQAFRGWAAAR